MLTVPRVARAAEAHWEGIYPTYQDFSNRNAIWLEVAAEVAQAVMAVRADLFQCTTPVS